MSAPAPDPKALLTRVQISRRQLGVEEEDWRALLERVTGLRSTREMSPGQLGRVLDELARLGAPSRGPNWRPRARHPHQRKVYALWTAMKRSGVWREESVTSLQSFSERVCGVRVIEWLTAKQASQVIEALKKIQTRAETPK